MEKVWDVKSQTKLKSHYNAFILEIRLWLGICSQSEQVLSPSVNSNMVSDPWKTCDSGSMCGLEGCSRGHFARASPSVAAMQDLLEQKYVERVAYKPGVKVKQRRSSETEQSWVKQSDEVRSNQRNLDLEHKAI
eukprot:Gb_18736 [translate_table: standard]